MARFFLSVFQPASRERMTDQENSDLWRWTNSGTYTRYYRPSIKKDKPLTNMTWLNLMFDEFWESLPGTIKYYLN